MCLAWERYELPTRSIRAKYPHLARDAVLNDGFEESLLGGWFKNGFKYGRGNR